MNQKIAKFTVLLLLISKSGFTQLPVPVDSLYRTIKTNSVYRNAADWAAIDQAFRSSLDTSKNIKDTMKAFIYVLQKLDDPHSAIYLNNQYYGYFKKYDNQTLKRLRPLIEKSDKETGKIRTALLQNRYAYVQIPGIQAWGEQINQYAQAINDSVCTFSAKNIKGFIIDLRLNGGGAVFPMISGVSALLGDNFLGGYTDINGKMYSRWILRKNNFSQGGQAITSIKKGCSADFTKLPVVILLGAVTKSSGSMTAIAFKGRSKTWFIGEPTADGYTTANQWYQLHDSLAINLANAYVANRYGTVYKTTVDPDQTITSEDNFEEFSKDEKIKAALNWLQKNSR